MSGSGPSKPPPPGAGRREVQVAGRMVPVTARATRREHATRLLGSRNYIWRLALFSGSAFLFGAATGNPYIAAAAPLAVATVILAMLWREAGRLARRDYFSGFALSRGFNYSERMSLMETTPLLGAGDRRHCEHYMEGPLKGVDNTAVGLSHYTFETHEERNDRRNRAVSVYTPHHFTICVADIPRAMGAFPGVFLSRRGGLFGRDSWLDRPGLTPIELESSTLASRYELLTRGAQDRTKLLELFAPSFQMWIASLPRQIFFEYSGGTLVVYTPKKVHDTPTLELMLDVTQNIAMRILREGEPLRAVKASDSAPPPAKRDFPAPPPATHPAVEPQIAPVPDLEANRSYDGASVPPPGYAG